MADAPTMLELDGIDTYRGPAQILRGVSLGVREGEAVCLVGRNGAGKTTTIDSIMGLLPVKSGRIVFKGRDITRLPTHRRALGATAICIGRPYLWGLAAFGQPGVERVLDILRWEFELIMRQAGATSLGQLNRSFVLGPAGRL